MPDKAEFHIEDAVRNIKSGKKFVVTAIMKTRDGKFLYAGEHVGWHSQDDLDHDYAQDQLDAMGEVDPVIHNLVVYLDILPGYLRNLRNQFNGLLPREYKQHIRELAKKLWDLAA